MQRPSNFPETSEFSIREISMAKMSMLFRRHNCFGDTFELALENLQSVFNSLRKANLKLKPKKCVLFQNHVKFWGHVVSDQGISCDED